MEIKIINAEKNHYNAMFEIHNKVFLEQDRMTEQNFYSEFKEPTRKYFVAINEKQEVIAYVGVIDTQTDYNIMGIAVQEEYQNKGIGTQLINYLKNFGKEKNVQTISLEVDEKNLVAINFYKKMGFVVTNIRKKYYKNNDAFIMWYYL